MDQAAVHGVWKFRRSLKTGGKPLVHIGGHWKRLQPIVVLDKRDCWGNKPLRGGGRPASLLDSPERHPYGLESAMSLQRGGSLRPCPTFRVKGAGASARAWLGRVGRRGKRPRSFGALLF